MFASRFTRFIFRTKMTTLSAIVGLGASCSAIAADPAAGVIAKAKADRGEQRLAALGQGGTTDSKPPRLTAFSPSAASSTPRSPRPRRSSTCTATDDVSGIQSVVLMLHSPSVACRPMDPLGHPQFGACAATSGKFAVGAQSFSDRGLAFSRYSEAGTSTADST